MPRFAISRRVRFANRSLAVSLGMASGRRMERCESGATPESQTDQYPPPVTLPKGGRRLGRRRPRGGSSPLLPGSGQSDRVAAASLAGRSAPLAKVVPGGASPAKGLWLAPRALGAARPVLYGRISQPEPSRARRPKSRAGGFGSGRHSGSRPRLRPQGPSGERPTLRRATFRPRLGDRRSAASEQKPGLPGRLPPSPLPREVWSKLSAEPGVRSRSNERRVPGLEVASLAVAGWWEGAAATAGVGGLLVFAPRSWMSPRRAAAQTNPTPSTPTPSADRRVPPRPNTPTPPPRAGA